jgi:hypothetical protein
MSKTMPPPMAVPIPHWLAALQASARTTDPAEIGSG